MPHEKRVAGGPTAPSERQEHSPSQPPSSFADLLRTGAACPKCRTAPPLRVGQALAGVVARVLRRSSVAFSYKCQNRLCGHVYAITAAELAAFATSKGEGPSER